MAASTRSETITVRPLQLGHLQINFPIGLAPMAGISNSIFRAICRDLDCGYSFTETISSVELSQKPWIPNYRLAVDYNEKPLGAQIFGVDPEKMAAVAKKIESLGLFDMIDINCGCPAKNIVGKGAGAALMNHPNLIRSIVHAVNRAVSIPVTVKTRIGLSPRQNNSLEIARAVEDGGASALTIHARYASDKHNGPANWEMLSNLKSRISIPIIGNGGIHRAEDAVEMLEQTGVDGVMIGRAAIGNPWIFRNIRHLIHGREINPPTPLDRLHVITNHLNGLTERMRMQRNLHAKNFVPEYKAALHFRTFLIKYLEGFDVGAKMLRKFLSIDSPDRIIQELHHMICTDEA